MWTAYEPLLNFSTRLTVRPGYLTSAAAVALSAASPAMIVPVASVLRNLTFDSLVRARPRRLLFTKHARGGFKADDRERKYCDRGGGFPGRDRSGELSMIMFRSEQCAGRILPGQKRVSAPQGYGRVEIRCTFPLFTSLMSM